MDSFIKPCGTPVVSGCILEVNTMTGEVTITLPAGVPSELARLHLMQASKECESCNDTTPTYIESKGGEVTLKVTTLINVVGDLNG
jgi:hypothetical protein|tara:strand:+ start:5 stop:262 length:258 start_codon:yes stop_codon:yes gene_type:complete